MAQNVSSQYVSYTAKEVAEQTKTYNSYSGSDIVAMCEIMGASIPFGTLQTISYSVHMERHPVRSIGNVNAKDYTQGPRTIAGSLVFAVFDKHILYHMYEALEQYNKNNKTKLNDEYLEVIADYQSFYSNRHILADELPPFNITIAFANEYGSKSRLALYGVRLVNEGQVMSINDVYVENTYQFVATNIDYMSTAIDEDSKYVYPSETGSQIEKDNGVDVVISGDRDDAGIKIKFISYDSDTSIASFKIYHRNEDDEYVPLDGGILRIDCLNSDTKEEDKTRKSIIGATTPTNPIQYVDLRLGPGLYSAKYYVGNNTDSPSDEIEIELFSKSKCVLAPFVYNIWYNTTDNGTKTKQFSFICPGIFSSHDKLCTEGPDRVIVISKLDNLNYATIEENSYKYASKQIFSCYDASDRSEILLFDINSDNMISFKEYATNNIKDDNIHKLIDNMNMTDPSLHLPVYILKNKDELTKDGGLIKKEEYFNILEYAIFVTNQYIGYINPQFLTVVGTKPSHDVICNYYILYYGPSKDAHNLMQQVVINKTNDTLFCINDQMFQDALLFLQYTPANKDNMQIVQPYYIYNPGGTENE